MRRGSRYTDEWEEELLKLSGGNEDDRELALTGTIPIRGWESGTYRVYINLSDADSGEQILLANEAVPQKTDTASVRWQCDRCTTMQVQKAYKCKIVQEITSLYEESRRRNHYNEKKKILYVVGLWKVVSYAEL